MPTPRMVYLTRLIRHGRIRSDESYRTGGRRKPAPIVHGTIWAYSGRGCRCETCVTAYLDYRSNLRHQPRTWPDWAHGRTTTYKAGCRCERCKAANSVTAARDRARRGVLDKRRKARLAYLRDRHQQIKAGTWRVEVERG